MVFGNPLFSTGHCFMRPSGTFIGKRTGIDMKNRRTILLGAGAVLCAIAAAGWLHFKNTGNPASIRAEEETEILISQSEMTEEADAFSTSGSTVESAAAAMSDTASTAAAADKAAAEEIPIDFRSIRMDCPDVYAWIRIPGTQIDYPVCQSGEGTDPDFYLNHLPDGTEEFAGSIYSQYYNKKDFSDPDTVLYGHDMADGSMFQNLHLFEQEAFFDNNREVLIYLPDRVLHFTVFAAYNTNDDHILLSNDLFEEEEVFDAYLQNIFNRTSVYSGIVADDTEVTKDSHVLTLSTCNAYEDQRFLVQCVLQE